MRISFNRLTNSAKVHGKGGKASFPTRSNLANTSSRTALKRRGGGECGKSVGMKAYSGRTDRNGKPIKVWVRCTRDRGHTGSHYATHPPR